MIGTQRKGQFPSRRLSLGRRSRPDGGSPQWAPAWLGPRLALIALVAASFAGRFGASFGFHAPWIAPDEMLYAVLGRSFWHTGQMSVLGTQPFYGFYPVFAGLPLAVFGPATGLVVLQAVQALLVSSTAAVAFLWARRLTSVRWALAAAAMTAALPGLAYSGLIMTESAFLPVGFLALWLLARALAEPSKRNQILAAGAVTLAVAVRLQSVGLFPAIVLAFLLFAWFERAPRHVLRFLPLALASALGLVILELARLALESGGTVAYQSSLGNGLHLAAVLRWTLRETGDAFLLVMGIPLLATFLLAATRVLDRRPDRDLSALLAVGIGYGAVTIVQVGGFVSTTTSGLHERYELAVAPVLFVAAAVWLGRGMPRPHPVVTTVVAVVVCLPALLLPVRQLVTAFASNDSFMLVPLLELARRTMPGVMVGAWIAGVVVIGATVVLLPRRAAPWLAGLLIVSLAGASLLAQRYIDHRSELDRRAFFGVSATQWVDRATDQPVAYLYAGDRNWNGVWQQLYWNSRIGTVALLAKQSEIPEGMPASVRPDGRIVVPHGKKISEHLIVAPQTLTLVGRRVTGIAQQLNEPGLALWQTSGAPTISTWTQGAFLDGQLASTIKVTVYACAPGALELTFRAEGGIASVDVSVNKLGSVRTLLRPGALRRLWVHAPKGADGHGTCTFYISPEGTVGSGSISFARSTSTVPAGVATHRLGRKVTLVSTSSKVVLSPTPAASTYTVHAGYCVGGQFVQLDYNQARRDPRYKGAKFANFVAGQGLTCSPPPPGYVRDGFATSDLGVPPGIYPYYAPAPSTSTTTTTTTTSSG